MENMNTPQHAIDAAKVLEGLEYCMDWKNQKPDAVRFATAMADARQFVIDARHPDPELARLREENERLKASFRTSSQNYANLLSGVKKMHTLIGQEFYSWQRIYQWIERAIAERDQLRARVTTLEQRILDDNKAFGCELRDPNGTIWEHADKLQKENAELRQSLENHAQANDKLVVEVADLRRDRENLVEVIEKMDSIHDDIMVNGPRCTCGDGDEWCGRCSKSSKLSSLANAAIDAARAKDAKTEGQPYDAKAHNSLQP